VKVARFLTKFGSEKLYRAWTVCLLVAAFFCGNNVLSAHAQQVSFRTYGVTDGLSNAWFACLVQDRTGFIFTCTEHGLYAYDGRRFSNLGPRQGLPDGGIVEAMAIDAAGRIILRYSHTVYMSTRSVSRDNPPESLSFEAALSTVGPIDDDDAGQMVAWGDGAVLAAHGRLYFVTKTSASAHPVIQAMGGLLRDQGVALQDPGPLAADGKMLWLARKGGGICEIGAQFRRCYGAEDGLPADEWESLLVEANGHVAARSTTRLADIDPERGNVDVSFLPDQGGRYLNYPRHLLLAATPAGQLLTQFADGLIVRDEKGWHAFGSANGLPSAPILSVLFDREANLWVGALGKGVMRALGYGVWDNIDHRDGLSNDVVWQMARQKGGPLWLATDGGIDAVDKRAASAKLQRHYDKPGFAITTDDEGHVWRSEGSTAISCITAATGEVKTFSVPAVDQILHGDGARLWIITEKGVYTIRDSRIPDAPEPVAQLPGATAAAVTAPDGSLWMLRQTNLVHWHSDGTLVTIKPEWQEAQFEPLTLARSKSGHLWVGGAGGGLYRLAVTNDQLEGMTRYGVPDIVSNMVVSLYVDSRDWVWAGTDNGLSVFNGKRWVSANTDSGLIWNDLDQGSLFEDDDGSMWIGTSQGLSHLRDPANLFKERTLQPVITSVTIGGADFRGRAVPYSRKPLEVRFGALNFEDDGVVRFRYRLVGVDEAWAETPGGYARYASIPPGHHDFEVVAYDPLTHQTSAPISITLRMKAPWWAWWPMMVLYALAACAIGYGVLRLRVRLLLLQQKALQREVENRTVEMRRAQAALQILAAQDSLTKLFTRGEIQARLCASLADDKNPYQITVGLVDIDHFKKINDRYGHLVGDEILAEMGRRVRNALGSDEYAGRYGGEEILVVLMSQEPFQDARIQELKSIICGAPFIVDGEPIQVTVSIGVAPARKLDNWKSLIGRADKALYEAKEQGRNRVIVASSVVLSA
jgi:diguanylate cyclase (GGDEF)-like protein